VSNNIIVFDLFNKEKNSIEGDEKWN
jgi:hypothetical protein